LPLNANMAGKSMSGAFLNTRGESDFSNVLIGNISVTLPKYCDCSEPLNNEYTNATLSSFRLLEQLTRKKHTKIILNDCILIISLSL